MALMDPDYRAVLRLCRGIVEPSAEPQQGILIQPDSFRGAGEKSSDLSPYCMHKTTVRLPYARWIDYTAPR
jgi:hypothetical protein